MHILENPRYLEMLRRLHCTFPHWDKLEGKTLFISGASGMLGSCLVDTVLLRNNGLPSESRCRVTALGRSCSRLESRFAPWVGTPELTLLAHDIMNPLPALSWEPDFLIHAASTTHPVAYATEPVNTITANVLGTQNLLELATQKQESRFLLLSSVEIYGQNRGDTDYFCEDYCGYINCNTLRAGYPEAKRVSEALCQAYIAQKRVDAVTIRLPRCYGPTMRMEDSKASSQFIKNALHRENIVLKSRGEQLYSYAHTADAVEGILWALLRGETGEAYNLADRSSDITLRNLAELAADHAGTKVIFDLPSETEKRGYSTASKALLDGTKLQKLGWSPHYNIVAGIRETIDILQEMEGAEQA